MSSSDEAETTPVKNMDEAAARLRSSRAGKASHLTRRMNIVNNLMNDGYLDEVKANMKRFNDLLDEFKALHISYTEMLDEDAKREDEDKWHQPRCAQITAFLNTVIEWISTMETDTSLSHGGPGDVDTHSVRSDKSGASSSSFTSSTLRISAEAERAALMAKASKLQEKHAIEEQEQILKKRRETLELQTKIAATTAKIDYLKEAEAAMRSPAQFLYG